MANPRYVANNPFVVPPVGPILFTDDLKTYVEQSALGALAFAAGATTAYGGDLYWDGTTIISTNFTNPAIIAVWQNGVWTLPLVLSDGNSYLGNNGNRQPATGSTAIDFDGTTYAVGGLDLNGNTSVFTAAKPATGPWTTINLETGNTFDPVGAMAWIPRLGLWIAIADQIWSSPLGAATWTSRSNADFYRQFFDDGTTLWVLGTTKIWSSTDGVTWSGASYPASFPFSGGLPSNLFYNAGLSIWVSYAVKGGPFSGHNGLLWAPSPISAWTYGYTSPNDPPGVPADNFQAIGQVGTTIYAVGLRETSTSPFETEAIIASTIDGKTWTGPTVSALPEVPSSPASILTGLIGAPDNKSIGLSLVNLNAANPLTNVYSTDGGATLANQYLPGRWTEIIEAIIPPSSAACIPFEIQSPGDMPDSGAQFTCQRLYITANLDISGVPQLITPTLIIDGVENVLPPITNTGRSTIEIPISKYHGRFFDGVRLDGCLTGRIEIFRIEADVWLGEQQESQ